MPPKPKIRILCVDDEQNILDALKRSMRKKYEVITALSGPEGLEQIEASKQVFEVIISDMRMPGMDGIAFLKKARKISPDSVRLLLTGYADLKSVISAVNEGHIFRFISKPCSTVELGAAIHDAAEHHRLIISEHVLLEQTLRGSIQALTDVLSLANPGAFGRATRIKGHAMRLAAAFDTRDSWALEVASMLTSIGSITLPPELVEKIYYGQELTSAETEMAEEVPLVSQRILSHIPRLDPVLEIMAHQHRRFDGAPDGAEPKRKSIPLGSRILKLVTDFETIEARGRSLAQALEELNANDGCYDPDLTAKLTSLCEDDTESLEIRAIPLAQLRVEMIFTEDVKSATGLLLIARGQEVSPTTLMRIKNFARTVGLKEPLWVRVPEEKTRSEQAETVRGDKTPTHIG